MIYPLLDWFIPAQLREDSGTLQRARMFLISHLFGPFLGHTITVYLFWLSPVRDYALWVLVGSITIFWLFPFALRITGWFTPLALLSVQNLIFAILWGCYHYGGVSSPFLPWLLTVPLLAFFYLGPGRRPRLFVLTIIAVNLGVFYFSYAIGHTFPEHIPLAKLSGIGIISTLCAAVYVSMMALYYANIVASQTELAHEVQRHLATARMLRDARVEAERADQAKSEFLAKMSHELRTPLNAVIGYSEILLEELDPMAREEQRADIKKINGAGKHLLNLITDILDLSKLDAGKMEVYAERHDLAALVNEVADKARAAIVANGNELIVNARDLGIIQTDAAKLCHAILNLLTNAAKFTRNGRVTLAAVQRDGWTTISVRDTGSGISAHDLANLFQNFREAEGATSSKYGGTGLGLALAQKLCRLMGGDISVESELGRGSRFTIRVPDRIESSDWVNAGRTLAAGASPSSRSGDPQNAVLIIDDDLEVLDLLKRTFQKEGLHPVVAADATEALNLARRFRPSAIILDIFMPQLDGWQVLQSIKADEMVRDCPVILLTISDDFQKARALGAAGYLTKPVDREALLRLLASLGVGDQRGDESSDEGSSKASEHFLAL